MAHDAVDDELWEQFHAAVNMTSAELEGWLRESEAGERPTETEPLPDQAGPATGRHVLSILRKRRADLTHDDADMMAGVVDRVYQQRGEDPEPTAGEMEWRHRLMDLGHDPLREA